MNETAVTTIKYHVEWDNSHGFSVKSHTHQEYENAREEVDERMLLYAETSINTRIVKTTVTKEIIYLDGVEI
jgi:hypothetical protein